MTLDENIKDATSTVSKAGAWAVLAVGLIVAIGWFIVIIAKRGDVLLSDYLGAQKAMMKSLADASESNANATEKVADAVASLVTFHDDVAVQHRDMMQSLTEMQTGDQDAAAILKQLVAKMESANKMMGEAVLVREADMKAQQDVLVEIREGINRLTEMMRDSCAVPAPQETPE